MITKSTAAKPSCIPLHVTVSILAASACLLSACGSTQPADEATTMGGKAIGKNKIVVQQPTPTPTPTPSVATTTSTGSVTYDASIGNGVDANGFANLPLRSGAHRYFVNGAIGSDSNGCSAAQSASTPLKTLAAGKACITGGNGDQVLVAEGETYPESMPHMQGQGGYSLVYPTVLETYDPADPLNEAKYGRPAAGNRPVFTGSNSGSNPFIMTVTGQSYIAVRGFDINPGNLSSQGIGMVDVGDGILMENNIFRYTGVGIGINKSPRAHHWIFRGNSFYGNWDSNLANHSQALYADGTDTLTIEDNVFWHTGWKIGATRDDPTGGATEFRHPIYQQASTDAITRRNLFVDGSCDGGSYRGNSVITENVSIDNPIGLFVYGGPAYNVDRPTGVNFEVSYNAIFGDADINSANPRGWGISTENGRLGSSVHHNLIARSRNAGGNPTYVTRADFNQPSYVDYHDNVSYLWSAPTSVDVPAGAYVAEIFETFATNLWDASTSGSNSNSSGHAFPHPYTASELYSALGFGSKQAFIDYAINNPEAHPARNARATLFAGYGIN